MVFGISKQNRYGIGIGIPTAKLIGIRYGVPKPSIVEGHTVTADGVDESADTEDDEEKREGDAE